MRAERRYCAAATIGDQICVVGVYDENDNILLLAEIYDPLTSNRTDLSPIRTKRKYCVAAAVRGQLCIFWFYDKNDNILSLEVIYDP